MFLNAFFIAIYLLIMFLLAAVAFKMRENKKEKLVVLLMFFSFSMLFFFIFEIVINATLFFIFLIMYTIIIVKIGKKNYTDLVVKDLTFTSSKIDKEVTVLFLADFQYDKNESSFNKEAFDDLIDKVNTVQYDMILLGGDYINYENYFDIFIEGINKIKNKDKAYAVIGNHDFFIKDKLINKFKNININVLENEVDKVNINGNILNVSGVKDMWYDEPDYKQIKDEINESNYHILISHNPDYVKEIKDENIDIILSGHYHKGQVNVLPKITLARLVTKYTYGLYNIKNIKLYVTSGVGGTFLRGKFSFYIRWNAKPEIVKIKLSPKK